MNLTEEPNAMRDSEHLAEERERESLSPSHFAYAVCPYCDRPLDFDGTRAYEVLACHGDGMHLVSVMVSAK